MRRPLVMSGLMMVLGATLLCAGGCVKRSLHITSDPPGALVWLNEREVGRTPVDVEFVHYGDYDVRLAHPGHEPLLTHARAKAPLWDAPGLDFFAEVSPFEHRSDLHWHFELEPLQSDPEGLKDRARELRDRLGPPEAEDAAESTEQTTDESETMESDTADAGL